MVTIQVTEIADQLKKAGVPPDFGEDRSRLLMRVLRTLAKGQPLTSDQVDQVTTDLKIPREDALDFLGQVAERDTKGHIIGLIGLSLNEEWSHRFSVNGKSLRTWCAWDTLFLPVLLQETATIESESPKNRGKVSLTVSPEAVLERSPAGAVVSIVVIDPDQNDVGSVEAIWGNFCHQVYFFGSREEAEEWSEGRANIAILSVDDAYELGRQAFSELLAYA